jgi:hypothetical protein
MNGNVRVICETGRADDLKLIDEATGLEVFKGEVAWANLRFRPGQLAELTVSIHPKVNLIAGTVLEVRE